MMPDWIRDMLAWNPVLQAVDWFRASFFADYVPHWLDRSYLAAVAGLVLLAGLALERGLRRGSTNRCDPARARLKGLPHPQRAQDRARQCLRNL